MWLWNIFKSPTAAETHVRRTYFIITSRGGGTFEVQWHDLRVFNRYPKSIIMQADNARAAAVMSLWWTREGLRCGKTAGRWRRAGRGRGFGKLRWGENPLFRVRLYSVYYNNIWCYFILSRPPLLIGEESLYYEKPKAY